MSEELLLPRLGWIINDLATKHGLAEKTNSDSIIFCSLLICPSSFIILLLNACVSLPPCICDWISERRDIPGVSLWKVELFLQCIERSGLNY